MEVINAIGRRKTATARVYLAPGNGKITVNNKEFEKYFPTKMLQDAAILPLKTVESEGKYDIKANLDGGGISGQAEALQLAISRALVKENEEVKPVLKAKKLLTRDNRMVERKKPGQKKARKRFQFSKR